MSQSFFDDFDDDFDDTPADQGEGARVASPHPDTAGGAGAGADDADGNTVGRSVAPAAAVQIRVFDDDSPQSRAAFTGQDDDRFIAPAAASVVTGRAVPDVPAARSSAVRDRPTSPVMYSDPHEVADNDSAVFPEEIPQRRPAGRSAVVAPDLPHSREEYVAGQEYPDPAYEDTAYGTHGHEAEPTVEFAPESVTEDAGDDRRYSAPVMAPLTDGEVQDDVEDAWGEPQPVEAPEPKWKRSKRQKRQKKAKKPKQEKAPKKTKTKPVTEISNQSGGDDGKKSKSRSRTGVTMMLVLVLFVALCVGGYQGIGMLKDTMNGSPTQEDDSTTVADASDETPAEQDEEPDTAEDTAANSAAVFERYMDAKCTESTSEGKTVTRADGNQSSPMKAIASWEYAYYTAKDANLAIGILSGPMAMRNDAATMQAGIDSAAVDGYCLSMAPVRGKEAVVDVTITEFIQDPASDYPRETALKQRITTVQEGGKWTVDQIEAKD